MSLRNGQANGSIRTWRRYFPLTSVNDVVALMQEFIIDSGIQPFRLPLHPPTAFPPGDFTFDKLLSGESTDNYGRTPNLAFVSTILGYIENQLTIHTQDCHSTRNCRSTVAPPSRGSPSASKHACSKIVIPPSPLSIQIDGENSIHAANSSSDPSPISTVSSGATTTPVHQQPMIRKRKRPHRFSSGSSSRSRRLRHTSASNVYPNVEAGGSIDSPHALSTTTMYSGENDTSKRRRFSETSLSTSHTISKVDQFPRLTFDDVEQYYREFHNLIVTSSLLSPFAVHSNSTVTRWADRELICSVLQVLWSRMVVAGRGRDRQAHTQSVYSFLTTGLLDSFGLAYTIVAACQLLGYPDVDLALSEDHGWVEFGPPDDRQTADVASWVHQRQQLQLLHQSQQHQQSDQCQGQQHLRLPSIREPPLTLSWLYVNGQPVVCRPRLVAMAAAVTAMQPDGHHDLLGPSLSPLRGDHFPHTSGYLSGSAPTVSYHLVQLKHRLLWLFYSSKCLARYPLALTNLADLEDTLPVIETHASHTETRYPVADPEDAEMTWPVTLYRQAVVVNQRYYNNQHVYPYTCLAGCLYRQKRYSEALRNWAEAARVIGQYKHSSEDLEVYRELLEIATNWMPQMFRSAAAEARSCSDGLEEADPDGCIYQPDNILDSPQCLAHLISFYDNLCLWEQSASVPVLHVGWVDKLMVNLGRFSPRARRHLHFDVFDADAGQPASVSVPSSTGSSTTTWHVRCRARTASSASPAVVTGSAATANGVLPKPEDVSMPLRDTDRTLVDRLDSNSMLAAPDKAVLLQQPISNAAASTTQVQLVGTRDVQQTSAVIDWHSVTSGIAEPQSVSQLRGTLGGVTGGEDEDASPSPPPLLLLPGDDQLGAVDDTEELLSSLAEACDRHLLNPAFLSGVEPNTPFLSADCKIDEAFDRLFANWRSAGDPGVESVELPASSSPPPPADSPTGVLAGASIFPTPPVSSGANMETLLSTRSNLLGNHQHEEQQQVAAGQVAPVTTHLADGAPRTDGTEDVAGLEMLKELFDSVGSTTQEDSVGRLGKQAEKKEEEIPLEAQLSAYPSQAHLSLGRQPTDPTVHLSLRSTKMVSIVELLRATRLNSSAIKLALTAQSQVSLRRSSSNSIPSPYTL